MAVDVLSEIAINKPIQEVATFSADPDNVKKWYKNISSVRWETERPAAVGSKVAFVANFMGRELSYTYEIVEFIANEILTMRTSEGPFPMETTYTWKSLGDSTRMTLRNRGEPKGFSVLLAPFMSLAIKKANQKDLLCLKQLLESRVL